jgi:hypothetical protein
VSLGHGPPRILHSVCSTFLAGGTTRLYCGRIKLVHKARIVVKRGHSVLSGGTARRRGTLLELRPKAGARLKPGRYKLVLLTRDGKRRLIKIRVIPPARAERASAGARPTSLAALCRIHNVNVLLGYHRRADGVRVSRWRVYQTPG